MGRPCDIALSGADTNALNNCVAKNILELATTGGADNDLQC